MPLDVSWLALSLVRGIGRKTLDNLLEIFATTDNVLGASVDELVQVRGIGKKIAEAIVEIKLHDLVMAVEEWQGSGVQIIPQYSEQFPEILRALDDAPLTLFVRGNYAPEKWNNAVAIIGTRQPNKKAKTLAFDLAHQVTQQGRPIVSGLALGIDTAAHKGALSANTVPTVAILGGGVLNIYPPQNSDLAEKILEKGALISENAPTATASASRLVTRNRIISGLCQDIIVVQSDAKGGAMHAVRAAKRQGRRVHTVDWKFSGNQRLLQEGASLINPENPILESSE